MDGKGGKSSGGRFFIFVWHLAEIGFYRGNSRQCSIKPLNIEADVCDCTEDFFLQVGEFSFAFLVHFFWVDDFTSDT